MQRTLHFAFILLFSSCSLFAQQDSSTLKPVEIKQYFFVMLTKGNNRTQDSVTAAKIQDGHMANITRLHKMGKILVAGPFGDDSNWRGIFIFDCSTKEEVEEYLKTDPAIKAGRLGYDIRPWYTAKNCVFM